MNGICGAVTSGEPTPPAPASEDATQPTAAPFEWRGPQAVLGGWRRPLYRRDALETQPVHGGTQVLVADAQLLAPDRLARALGLPAHAWRQTADSALLLAAWQRWGVDGLVRIEGGFCMAVWDTRTRTLTLVRDALGLRPLYVAISARACAFGTRLPALAGWAGADTRLNETAIADYLAGFAGDDVSTVYRGIERLPPAGVLTWAADAPAHRQRYWDVHRATHVRFKRPEEYAHAVRERVGEVIANCCDTDAPVGLVLSGGLDSSTVAGIAARHLAAQGRQLITASSVLPPGHVGAARDERPYIEAVCALHPNIRPHWVTAPDVPVLDPAVHDLTERGQPAWNSFAVMERALNARLAAAGARVVLDGLHGDSVWSFEHPVFVLDFLSRGWWPTAWREARDLSRRHGFGRRAFVGMWRGPYAGLLPRPGQSMHAQLERMCGPSAVHPDLARRTRLLARVRRARWQARPGVRLRAAQRADLGVPIWARLREEIACTGALAGMDLRSPVYERGVVELCLSAPPQAWHRDGYGRSVVRDAGTGCVPTLVRLRTDKGAFLPDFHARVARQAGAYRALFAAAARSGPGRGIFDLARVDAALAGLGGEVAVRRWTLDAQAVVVRGGRMARFLLDYEQGRPEGSAPV